MKKNIGSVSGGPVWACCLIAALGLCYPSSATDSGASQKLTRLEAQLQQAVKRGKPDEEADALYDLAKAHFEAGEPDKAAELMRQSLEKENSLHRLDAAIRTRVAMAAILVASHRGAEASEFYNQALQLAQQQGKDEQAGAILDSLGALALVNRNLDEAQKCFEQSRDLASKNKNSLNQARALVNLAMVARGRNQLNKAIDILQEAVPILKEVGDNVQLGTAIAELGKAQADSGKLEEAIASDKEAADLFKEDQDDLLRGRVLISLGSVYLVKDQPAEAEAVLKEASDVLAAGHGADYIDALTALGSAKASAGSFDDQRALHQQAMKLAQDSGDGAGLRKIKSEIAYCYLLQGSPEKALDEFTQSYSMLLKQEPDNARSAGVLLSDIAQCYRAVGQTDAAISTYQQSEAAFTRAGDQAGRALALNGLAVTYLDSGKANEFENYYKQARDLYSKLQDSRGSGVLLYNYAQYQLVQGHYADAVPLYQEALKQFQAAHDEKSQGQVLRGLGLAYLYQGKPEQAKELYQQALPIAERSASIEGQWDCQLGLGKALKAMGQIEPAIEHLRLAADLVEKERRQLSRDSFKTFNMDLRQDCFQELVDSLAANGDAEGALEIAERGRARAFLDMMEGRRSSRSIQLVSSAEDAQESSPIKLIAGAEANSRSVQVVPRALKTVEVSAISPVNALPPSLSEIKSLVSTAGSTVLEYFVLPKKVLVWIIHPDGKVEMPPPVVIARQTLTDKIAATSSSISKPPKSFADAKQAAVNRENNLKDLHKLLVQPYLSLLPNASQGIVTVVPHGPLFSVPFAALMDSRGRYLVEDYTLNYVPAIGVLRATQKLAQDVKEKPQNLLAFGNPITKSIAFLGTLPYSEKEVEHVSQLFGADRSTVFVGEKATRPTFVQEAPAFSVLHLATHGLIDEEHPMDSALVLAPHGDDDGLLTVKEILKLPQLNARLVVLSACQTAKGKITGDGVIGLSRAFVIAGTPAVLVSQWNVDDVMTEYQMVEFYKQYLKNQGNARSLREAQLKTIALMEKPPQGVASATATVRANPRYWAAFQLIGEAQ